MTGDWILHFLPHYTYSKEYFISGGYSIKHLIWPTCSLLSPTIKYELTFYQVETRTE
jgi:hypothetical protein